MTASSWLSSTPAALSAIAACALATGAAPFVGLGAFVPLLGAAELALVAGLAVSHRRTSTFLSEAARVCGAIRRGDFDQRLILPSATGQIKAVVDRMNGLIDINDAFVREAALAMAAVSEGRYYRKIRPEGMQGAYLKSVTGINGAIELMAARQAMIEEAIAEVGRVAAAATEGDLDQRIDGSRFSGDYLTVTQGMNALLDSVSRPIEDAGRVLDSLARTNLTARMDGQYRGAFARLQHDINTVTSNMARIMGQLRGTARSLKVATSEILAGANDLSDRTTKQAATIEETSAAMEQLASTVVDNARRAEEATEKARLVSVAAEEGGLVMKRATEAMERISDSSSRISSIIGMIDDIAFQTNLLALNASVEAARAGEAGKGFAVVAIEVRRLAQSAAEASREIKDLIDRSASEVTDGARLVAEAERKLLAMLDGIRQNSQLIDAISGASRDQASAIEEVAVAVRQMDQMTQHNAALVEETNAAIEQTEGQAAGIDEIVDVFVLEETTAAAPAAAGHRARAEESAAA